MRPTRTIRIVKSGAPAMELSKEVGKRGFRKWHERQLIESHVYLTTCILCALALAVFFEAYRSAGNSLRGLVMLLASFVCGIIAIHAWQRYRGTMVRAQRFADKATCTRCGVYGILNVTEASRIAHPVYDERGVSQADDKNATWLRVRCKHCGHEWAIS
jgi:protein-S-isoprenylcysteine O-methyltransferase Ste14